VSVSVSVSRIVRLELEARFGDLFNDALLAAFEAFGAPAQAFAINFSKLPDLPKNYYRGNRSIESLLTRGEPDLPALAMWIGGGQNLGFEKPRIFSGFVSIHWRFFLFVEGVRDEDEVVDALVEQREAVEAALIAVLDAEFPTFGYRGDVGWEEPPEQQIFSQDDQHFGWSQEVLFTASFEVNV